MCNAIDNLTTGLQYSKRSIGSLLSHLEPFVKAEALVYFIQALKNNEVKCS